MKNIVVLSFLACAFFGQAFGENQGAFGKTMPKGFPKMGGLAGIEEMSKSFSKKGGLAGVEKLKMPGPIDIKKIDVKKMQDMAKSMAFMGDRDFARRVFVASEKKGEGAKEGKMMGRGGEDFARKVKEAEQLGVTMTNAQSDQWNQLAKDINAIVDKFHDRKKKLRESMEKKGEKDWKEKVDKELNTQLKAFAGSEFDALMTEKRQLMMEKRTMKKDLVDLADGYVMAGDPSKTKDAVIADMIKFKREKMSPLKAKMAENKYKFELLKSKFYASDASSQMIKDGIEKIIKKAEENKDMLPLMKEYKDNLQKLYDLYKTFSWPAETVKPENVIPSVVEAELGEVVGAEEPSDVSEEEVLATESIPVENVIPLEEEASDVPMVVAAPQETEKSVVDVKKISDTDVPSRSRRAVR